MTNTPKPQANTLDEIFDNMNGSGAHACYCQRSTDGGCKCAIKDEYVATAKQQLLAEVLELAPEVDERLFRENAQYYFGKKEAIQEYQSNLRKGIA